MRTRLCLRGLRPAAARGARRLASGGGAQAESAPPRVELPRERFQELLDYEVTWAVLVTREGGRYVRTGNVLKILFKISRKLLMFQPIFC